MKSDSWMSSQQKLFGRTTESHSCTHLLIPRRLNKLEEIRAKNKCQQIMMASVSHEFRTPLNAFSNSLNLIEFVVKDLK